jgi:RNA polymerase sigma-70 factor, ECF subfamily
VAAVKSAPVPVRAKKRQRPDSRLHATFRVAQTEAPSPLPQAGAVYWSPRKHVDLYSFDADYLRRLKARDPATEEHFVSYFSPRMQVKLRHRGFASPVLEDVSQETFFRVLTAVQADNVLYPERFGAYVHSVCDKVILEKFREFARNQHLDLDGMDVPDRKTNLEAMLLRKEKRRIVEEILDELPVKKRNILRALIFEQLDREELCVRFGVNADYLRVLLFRAKEDFAERLRARGLDGLQGGGEPH